MSDIKKDQESVFRALEGLDSIVIDQKENVGEACLKCLGCCCVDSRNQYDWSSGDKNLFSAKEKSSCATRSCCNPNHALSLHVTPEGMKKDEENDVLVIDRPFKCCCLAVCCFRKEITITRPSEGVIGFVQEPTCGGICRPKLNMYDKEGGIPMGVISGPLCCIGGCMGRTGFDVYGPDGQTAIGEITKKSKGAANAMFSDADKYELSFKGERTIAEKLVMISSTIFLDYLFFEGETNCKVQLCPCPPSCWCKLCQLYCMGCTCPVYVKCCWQEAAEAAKNAHPVGSKI